MHRVRGMNRGRGLASKKHYSQNEEKCISKLIMKMLFIADLSETQWANYAAAEEARFGIKIMNNAMTMLHEAQEWSCFCCLAFSPQRGAFHLLPIFIAATVLRRSELTAVIIYILKLDRSSQQWRYRCYLQPRLQPYAFWKITERIEKYWPSINFQWKPSLWMARGLGTSWMCRLNLQLDPPMENSRGILDLCNANAQHDGTKQGLGVIA